MFLASNQVNPYLLYRLHNGKKSLSTLLEESLAADPLSPLLWKPHLIAIDRRLSIILHAIRHCIEIHTTDNVIVWDV